MTIVLIILAAVAAVYIYATIAYYYGFKDGVPFCGCKGAACSPAKKTCDEALAPR
jgi:hypothetical protein